MTKKQMVFQQSGAMLDPGYQGPRSNIDVAQAAEELVQYANRCGNVIDWTELTDHVRANGGELSNVIEHDPERAHLKYNIEQLRSFAGALRVRLIDPKTGKETPGNRLLEPRGDGKTWRIPFRVTGQAPPAEPKRFRVVTASPPALSPFPKATDEAPGRAVLPTPEPTEQPGLHMHAQIEPEPAMRMPPEPIVLTERQIKMRDMLCRVADNLSDDDYFAAVVRAIRQLPQ